MFFVLRNRFRRVLYTQLWVKFYFFVYLFTWKLHSIERSNLLYLFSFTTSFNEEVQIVLWWNSWISNINGSQLAINSFSIRFCFSFLSVFQAFSPNIHFKSKVTNSLFLFPPYWEISKTIKTSTIFNSTKHLTDNK